MMTPSDPIRCPECGKPVPAASKHGICPSCLLRQALVSQTLVENREGGTNPGPPPSADEIAGCFPQFEVTECLGRGGMGVVYKARQKSLDRWVAIKILSPERRGEEKFAERFAREAQTLARLNNPNIVTVYDYGETSGLFYIVMEYVDGVNLRDLLRDGKLEPEKALAIVPPICEALQYAHDKGVVHRDIKPENILLDRDGRIKIADFGIAALAGSLSEYAGTPPYMAPEQAGTAAGVDHRADIYALGVVLYEMLTGERPKEGAATALTTVPHAPKIDQVVRRAMAKEPAERFQTAAGFRAAAESAAVVARPPSLPAAKRGMFRRWWWVGLLIIPLGLILGLAAGGVWSYITPPEYESSVKCLFRPSAGSSPSSKYQIMEEIESDATLGRVAERLKLSKRWAMPDDDVRQVLRGNIRTDNIRGTDLLVITARSMNLEECRELADEVVKAYQPPPGASMAVVEEASIPSRPVGPNVWLTLIVSGFAGLVLSLLAALPVMALLQKLLPDRAAKTTI